MLPEEGVVTEPLLAVVLPPPHAPNNVATAIIASRFQMQTKRQRLKFISSLQNIKLIVPVTNAELAFPRR
jgi:hypothetical protein